MIDCCFAHATHSMILYVGAGRFCSIRSTSKQSSGRKWAPTTKNMGLYASSCKLTPVHAYPTRSMRARCGLPAERRVSRGSKSIHRGYLDDNCDNARYYLLMYRLIVFYSFLTKSSVRSIDCNVAHINFVICPSLLRNLH